MNWGPKSKPLVRKTGRHHARNRSAKHAEIKLVRVEDVIIPSSAREPDPKIVSFIADSIRTNKLIHPIAVRYEFDSLRRTSKKTLVAGGNHLAASRMLGEEFIPCTFVEDDDTVVRLVQISENLSVRI